MKNTKYLLLLLPIALVVLISGCTGGGGPQLGNGVIILNFEPDFSSVESGDEVRFYLQIQNQGEEQANNVIARITGIDPSEWRVDDNSLIYPFYSLTPPNPTYGTEGETAQYYFSPTLNNQLFAPDLPEGITQTYTPMVRVYYDYKTSATKQITVVAEDELRRLMQEGRSLPTGETQYSSGPISVSVVTGKYIKAKPVSGYYFPIMITLNNVGGGVVSEYKERAGDIPEDYVVYMNLELPSGLIIDLEDNCFTYAHANTFDTIRLWKGKSETITCNLEIKVPPTVAQQKTFKINLEYHYYIDSTTSVTVKGTGY